MPGHHSVVDGVAVGREALGGRGNLAAILLAAQASTVPVAAPHALHVGQGAVSLESGGADKLHLGAGRMVGLVAVHLLAAIDAQGLGRVALELARRVAVFYE